MANNNNNILLQSLAKKARNANNVITGDAIDGRVLVEKVEDIKNVYYCYVGMLFSTADDTATIYKVTKIDENKSHYSQALEWAEIDAPVTTSTIKVAGGAINATGIWANDEIPAGTSTQEILSKLLCKEINPSSPVLPGITATTLGTPISGVMKIGNFVTVNAFTANTDAGHFVASYSNIMQPATNVKWTNIKYSTSSTGFTSYNNLTNSNNVDAQYNIPVSLGLNKISCIVSGHYSAPTASPLTNLGNITNNSAYTFTEGNKSSEVSVNVYGVYPIYHNSLNQLVNLDVNNKAELILDSNVFEVSYKSEMNSNNRVMFACPSTHSVIKIEIWNSMSNGGEYQEQVINDYFTIKDSDINVNGINYKLYVRDIPNNKIGESKYRFTLNKKTSE